MTNCATPKIEWRNNGATLSRRFRLFNEINCGGWRKSAPFVRQSKPPVTPSSYTPVTPRSYRACNPHEVTRGVTLRGYPKKLLQESSSRNLLKRRALARHLRKRWSARGDIFIPLIPDGNFIPEKIQELLEKIKAGYSFG